MSDAATKQTRRRGAALENAILDAAWEEVRDYGWDGFAIDGVAVRAGTAKAVIYRRWANRVALAEEMLRRTTGATRDTFAPAGDLRTDLLHFLSAMSAFLRSPFGQVVRGVLCEGEVPALMSVFGDHAIVEDVRIIVEHACATGQLPRPPSNLAVNLGHAVMMSEFLHTGTTPEPDSLIELVDTVWLPALGLVGGHAN